MVSDFKKDKTKNKWYQILILWGSLDILKKATRVI